MDPVTIAAAVVAFLASYLAEGGKAMAKKVGEALWGALERRFKGQPAAEEAMERMKAAPQDPDSQEALRLQLDWALRADLEFIAELAQLLGEAQTEMHSATYQAVLEGSGAIAQGPGAAAAGTRGIAIGGSVEDDER